MFRNMKIVAVCVSMCFLTTLLAGQGLAGPDHVVSATTLHQALISSAAVRKNNIHQVESFLSSKQVQVIAKRSGLDLKEVRQAVPSLSNQELAQLARTTQKAQSNFAGGALTHAQLTLIIAAAIVVVIILAIKA